MKCKLSLSEKAIDDLDELYDYILLSSSDIATARKNVLDIIDYIQILSDNPEIGRELIFKELKTEYRYIVYNKQMVFYKILNKEVIVCRIISSRRDYINVLFNGEQIRQ